MKTAIALLLAVAAWGQPSKNLNSQDEHKPNLPAQKIGPNDLISVEVYNAPELSRTIRVGGDGYIRMPMMKQRLKVDGLMPPEVEAAIAVGLKHEQIMVEPYVTVTMAEYHSRPISVMGAVKTPLTFQADSTITLLDALARADGLAPEAGPEILISRKPADDDPNAQPLVQRIPVKALMEAGDPNLNVHLTGGEEIRVPTAGKIFVVGNVKAAGAFTLQDSGETTLLKALALAGGLAPYPGKQAYIIRREANGAKNELPVELAKIIGRKAPDVPLQADDILYVPDATGRRATLAALEKVLAYGTGATAALIYAGVR